jgi:DNA-binding IclR family transcriptional regulator
MRLHEIASGLGLPSSTVLRFLNTMAVCGYVAQDAETVRYYLTMRLCRMGNLVSAQHPLRDIVRPFLVELSASCGELACLAVERDLMVVYIDVVEGPDSILKTLQRIGKIAPLHSTGVGKTLLLGFPNEKLERFVESGGLRPVTRNTITTREGLIAELARIREQGYALDEEECEEGVRCVAAPLRDYSGDIVASISISGPVSRMPESKIERIQREIVKTAAEVSRRLGAR